MFFILFRPSALDNFALISGQLNSLGKVLKNERSPHLRNHLLLPLALRPDRDAELEVKLRCKIIDCFFFSNSFLLQIPKCLCVLKYIVLGNLRLIFRNSDAYKR